MFAYSFMDLNSLIASLSMFNKTQSNDGWFFRCIFSGTIWLIIIPLNVFLLQDSAGLAFQGVALNWFKQYLCFMMDNEMHINSAECKLRRKVRATCKTHTATKYISRRVQLPTQITIRLDLSVHRRLLSRLSLSLLPGSGRHKPKDPTENNQAVLCNGGHMFNSFYILHIGIPYIISLSSLKFQEHLTYTSLHLDLGNVILRCDLPGIL